MVRPYLSERVRWFNLAERCGSQSFPNNEGIARSVGRLIAYLGHDDIWSPDHLQSLAALFEQDPSLDFAVSGAIYYGPEGSDFRQVTGLFDDATAPFNHFFPTVEFRPPARRHRPDRAAGTTRWRSRAPVDADLLLRAAHEGMRFGSTQRITLHKFAAGHRYLSYLAHDSADQEEMLRKIESPDYHASVEYEVERAKADGSFMVVRYLKFETFEKGFLATAGAILKGNIRPELRPLTRREVIMQDNLPRALDWKDQQRPDDRIRWVDRNPRPKILLPFSAAGRARIELTVAHADPKALDRLALRVNDIALDAALSWPWQVGEIFEARATVTAPLRSRDQSIVELVLTEAQRSQGPREGIGIGEVVLSPAGWRALAARARSFVGRCRRRIAQYFAAS